MTKKSVADSDTTVNLDEVEGTTSAEGSTPGPTISIVDLQNAVRILDHCADQGVFRGWSVIEQVYDLRTRLNDFVTAFLPKEEPASDETAAESSEAN